MMNTHNKLHSFINARSSEFLLFKSSRSLITSFNLLEYFVSGSKWKNPKIIRINKSHTMDKNPSSLHHPICRPINFMIGSMSVNPTIPF